MPVELTLTVDAQENLIAACEGAALAPPTPLASLPALTPESNPYFYDARGLGAQLYAALGGDALRDRLDASWPRVLYLTTDDRATALPWEYACMGDDFLALHYGFLRRVTPLRPIAPAPDGPLHFLALAADPLVDERGAPVTQRLAVEREFAQIEATLRRSNAALDARRVPPTIAHLQRALRQGPALLHLSCHGSVETILERGTPRRRALLQLEDPNGAPQYLRGDRLVDMAPPGVLRLVVFSACLTSASAQGAAAAPGAAAYANLARAMVVAGTPAAVGMQGLFPDPLSDEFAAALYDYLLAGQDLAEALRQARSAVSKMPGALGLPVGYVAASVTTTLTQRRGDAEEMQREQRRYQADLDSAHLRASASLRQNDALQTAIDDGAGLRFVLAPGQPVVEGLQAGAGYAALPADLAPPAFFVGRGAELHRLARLFCTGQEEMALEQAGADVVTVVGTGGIGKTTLAGAFAQRFGWRCPGGVAGATLATLPTLAPAAFLRGLAGRMQIAPPETLAQLDAESLADLVGESARQRQTLLLIDNYESVLQGLENGAAADEELRANAQTLHRAIARWASQGVMLLLTSRQHPAGFAGEVVFPDARGALEGVDVTAGAALFFHHSTRARQDRTAHADLARAVAAATEGHPLAIALLAGEFDVSDGVTPAQFLAGWEGELAAAQRPGLAAHHVRFEVAFRRSFDALAPAAQARLVQLSRFPAPFFAEMAARLWDAAAEDDAATAAAAQQLGDFVRRSLLKVDGWYDDGGRPATFRFDPATQRTVAARWAGDEDATGMAAAADWLVSKLYTDADRNYAMAQLGQQWLQALVGLAPAQPDERRPWYAWRLSTIAGQFGNYGEAWALLELAEEAARAAGDEKALSCALYEQANRWVTRGDLDRALGLYQESLAIKEKLGDIRGKAVTLNAMADVYVTRGDLDRALGLYQESLAIKEKLGDIREKAVTQHQMATVYVTRGDLDRALGLYQESLAIQEKLGDIGGKSATLHEMANVYVTRGDLDRALGLYQESLAIQEKLGDISGKSVTLDNVAFVHMKRGDLDRALGLYQESLAIKEKLGDIRGMTTTLSMMANLRMNHAEWNEAEELLTEALRLAGQLKYPREIAFNTVKLGQVAQGRGDIPTARIRYQEGLAIFQRLGMPEANQVRAMLAALEDGGQPAAPATPGQNLLALVRAAGEVRRGRVPAAALQQALAQAAGDAQFSPAMHALLAALGGALAAADDAPARPRHGADAPAVHDLALRRAGDVVAAFDALVAAAAPVQAEVADDLHIPLLEALARFADGSEQPAHAVAWLAQAIDRQRALPVDRRSQEALSVLLFNHAGFLANAGDLAAAVAALEEVVALDEAWQLPDLASDRQALDAMRRRRDGVTGDVAAPEDAAALLAQLAAQMEAQLNQMEPAQRAQAEEAMRRFASLSPDEQAALLAAGQHSAIDAQADEVVDAVLRAAAEDRLAALIPDLDDAAAAFGEGEAPGSPYAELAAFVVAVAALLRGEAAPAVPAGHVARFAALRGKLE